MTRFETCKIFYDNYYASQASDKKNIQKMIDIRYEHTMCVIKLAKVISKKENLNVELTEIIALFHDLARAYQIKTYETLSDKDSIDHADYAVEILKKEHVLKDFTQLEQTIILDAIQYHNKFIDNIPDVTKESKPYVQLIRDADKIDIFRVVLSYQDLLQLSYTQNPTLDVVKQLVAGKQVLKSSMKNPTDDVLLKLSWMNELYYTTSWNLLEKARYIEKLLAKLPPGCNEIKAYCTAKISEKPLATL
ncbi:MAG: HD domain-containing protein [Candidatus Woesearchaeota archaeon]